MLAALVLALAAIGSAWSTDAVSRASAEAPLAGTGSLSGIVTTETTHEVLAGAWVAVLRSRDFTLAAEAVADDSGAYAVDLPAGSYYLYLIDPTGRHGAGFWGAPDLVRVSATEVTSVDPTMALSTGSLTGVVSDDVSGEPISGAWAIALTAGGAPEAAAITDGSGRFTLTGLRAGEHRIAYLDPTATHATEFYADSADAVGSAVVPVPAGGTASADASLPRQIETVAFAALRGRVTEVGSERVLPGALVIALRADDYTLAGATVTGGSGRYRLNVQPGSYKLAILDPTGNHDMQWYRDQPYHGLDEAESVAAPSTTNVALASSTGVLQGSVADEGSGEPVADAWVLTIDATGEVRGAVTDATGHFEATGLPVGTYRAALIDTRAGRPLEYWSDSPDFAGAEAITVTASSTATITAGLDEPRPPPLLDSATGWWSAASGLQADGSLSDESGAGHDMTLHEGYAPSYPPALVAPDPSLGRQLFSPGWDDMYLDTPDPAAPVTGVDVAWSGDLEHVLAVNADKEINWVVHQGSSADGSLAWAVGIVTATGHVIVERSEDGVTASSITSHSPFPTGAQRGAVTVDPESGDLTLYRQAIDAPAAAFDLPYTDPSWEVVDTVGGTGPMSLFDSAAPIRHSSAIPRDLVEGRTAEGWFKALYRLRVRSAPDGVDAASFDVGLIPTEPEWFTETGLPPLYPENDDAWARSTSFPGHAGDMWTIHNYMTGSYPILIVDRPYILFGNHSYGSMGVDEAFDIGSGQDLSVWIAYSYPRVGGGGGPFVGVKNWSSDGASPGWMLLDSPFFGGPSAVVSDGVSVVYDPAPDASDSRLDISGFQVDGKANTIQSFTNGTATDAPVSLDGLGPITSPGTALTVAGYGDDGPGSASFAFAAMAVFPRLLTPDEIQRLPLELGLAGG